MKIKSQTFRLSALAIMVAAAGVSMSSHAVYNLYKKDGLTFDVHGQADVQFVKSDNRHELLVDADRIGGYLTPDRVQQYNHEPVPAGEQFHSTDKELRLTQDNGISYVDFRGAQELANGWRITGNMGMGYATTRDLFLSNAHVSFDKKNIGAISLGRQYLHTNYVTRTGTDSPLDYISTGAVRLDYYGLPGLHTSAYYSFANINDVRSEQNSTIKSGYGVSGSFKAPIGDGADYVRLAAGYTEHRANPNTSPTRAYTGSTNTLNFYPAKTQGVAGSVELKTGDLTVAFDAGRKLETMSSSPNTVLDNVKTDYLGAKVAYDINPVFRVSAGYGVKKAKKNLKDGAPALFNSWDNFDANHGNSYVIPHETVLFNNIDSQEVFAQLDYRVRPNVKFYTRYDNEVITNKLNGQDFSKITDKNYRAGVVFTF